MAIDVNEVYRTVLFILNKEQRGYITPSEFDKLATQVQLDILENYFEYENKQYRLPDNESEYSDRYKNIDEKIAIFKETSDQGFSPMTIVDEIQDNTFYKLGTVIYNNDTEVQKIQPNDLLYVNKSPLTAPTTKYPVYTLANGVITTSPTIGNLSFTYLRKPNNPRWGYSIGTQGQYIYDPNPFVDNGLVLGTEFFPAPGTTANPGTYNFSLDADPGGSGQNASFLVEVDALNQITSITVAPIPNTLPGPGSNWVVGDTITFTSTEIPGLPASFTITISSGDIYNFTTLGSRQIELHATEQTDVIIKILMYSGVIIRDPQIVQNAAQMNQQETIQENS